MLSAAACGGDSSTGPADEITLYFCEVAWAAYQNEGESWTVLPPNPRETTFVPSERLAIATVSAGGPQLAVRYLTAEQAKATFICGAPPSNVPSTKLLNGSVAGVAADAQVFISMGRNLALADATSPTFQVGAIADGPSDLVAGHEPPPVESPYLSIRRDKMIVRRGENHANGATMPVLDFASPEAFAPQVNTLTVDGLGISGAPRTIVQNVVTQRGADGFLGLDIDRGGTLVTMFSVPTSRLAEGDLHEMDVSIADRAILFYYHAPGDRTLSVGPTAFLPLITQPTNAPDQVATIEVTSQSDYDSRIGVTFSQPLTTGTITHSVTATKEYFGGTPAKWSLVLPDLTGMPGFSPSWALSAGNTLWQVSVSGVPFGFSSTSARDGDIYRGASVSGSVVLGQ